MATTAVSITDARKNLKALTDDVINYHDHLIITKPKKQNVVVLSEDEYQSWKETLYVLSSDANRQALDESIDQMETGNTKTLSKSEWQNLINED